MTLLNILPILMVFLIMQAQINNINEELKKIRRILNKDSN